jgi:hypothetical protein
MKTNTRYQMVLLDYFVAFDHYLPNRCAIIFVTDPGLTIANDTK